MTLVERFLTGTYEVTRSKNGSYEMGRYVPGADETIQMNGSLQPTNARELKIPEEGARLKQFWKFYTDKAVLTIGTKSLSKADVIKVNGETYKVWSVEIWQGTVDLPYFMSILYREPQQ